jgi:hypothetical protein
MSELDSAICITSLRATADWLCSINIEAHMDAENDVVVALADKKLNGRCVDRVVIYNPDAVALWLYQKYTQLFTEAALASDLALPMRSVMPSVAPVCFASMYAGVQPSEHGIQKYEKPVLTIDTFFDALVRAGKKVALITYKECSLGLIYLGRDISYYHYPNGDISNVNAKAMELLFADEYDVIIIYNGNYDSEMHKSGPESVNSLAELRLNDHVFSILSEIKQFLAVLGSSYHNFVDIRRLAGRNQLIQISIKIIA